MPKQPDNKNQSTRHHNRRSPEPGQNHALTLNGRIMVLLLVIGFIAAGCGVLIYKLYTLQIRDAEQYRVQAAEQQLSDTQIPATRGSIYSANGKLLAKSSVVWNIIANPSKCNQDYVAEASQKISELLNGSVSAEKIQEQLDKGDAVDVHSDTLTAQDFRFTTHGDALYAIAFGWPEDGEFCIRTLRKGGILDGEIKKVTMLGNEGELAFYRKEDELYVKAPEKKPCDCAYVLKIN